MAILSPNGVYTVSDGTKEVKVYTKIMPDSLTASKTIASWVKAGMNMKPCRQLTRGKPSGITIHNTNSIKTASNTTEAETYVRSTYNENMSGVIVHYYVDSSCIWQLLRNNEQGWHAKDGTKQVRGHSNATYATLGGNVDTIAIEVIGNSEEAENNAALLTAYLLNLYGLTVNDVYTHNYWMYGVDKVVSNASKNCPLYILGHWEFFLYCISERLNNITSSTSSSSSTNASVSDSEDKLYCVIVGSFGVRANALAYAESIKKKGYNTVIKVYTSGSTTLYRVQIGAFRDYDAAKAYAVKASSDVSGLTYNIVTTTASAIK